MSRYRPPTLSPPTIITVTETTQKEVEKIQYIPQLKSNDQMTEGQKQTVTNYNLMRNTLIKNGLMNEK